MGRSIEYYGNGTDWCSKPATSNLLGQGEFSSVFPSTTMIPTWCRMAIPLLWKESRIFVVLSSSSTPRSLSALHTSIFRRDPSYLLSRLYQAPSPGGLLTLSRCNEGSCCHGQRRHCNGLDTLRQSYPSAVPQTGTTLSVDPMIRRYVSGMSKLVLPSAALYRGTLTLCGLLRTPLMGSTSPLVPAT